MVDLSIAMLVHQRVYHVISLRNIFRWATKKTPEPPVVVGRCPEFHPRFVPTARPFRRHLSLSYSWSHLPGGCSLAKKKLNEWAKITIFNGKIHYKWPFSIAMLVHQRLDSRPKMVIATGKDCEFRHFEQLSDTIRTHLATWIRLTFQLQEWHYMFFSHKNKITIKS